MLANDVGIAGAVPVVEMTKTTWDQVLDTNLKGAFVASRVAVRLMCVHGGGAIVNVASSLGRRVASKAGLIQLMQTLELARNNIEGCG